MLYELAGGSTLTRFENGELDVAFISVNDIDRARDPNSDIGPLYQEFSQFTISYLAFNTQVPPFDDVNVRRALGLSIDRNLIAEVTFKNMIAPATGILMPQLPGYTPEDKTFQFDPDEARRLLAESKYGSAEELPPIVITEVGGGAEARIDTQAFIEQWREELGIEVRIQQTDFATFLDDQDSGRLQMFNAGWIMDYPDPEDILDLKFHSESELNDVGYSNAEVDAILDRAPHGAGHRGAARALPGGGTPDRRRRGLAAALLLADTRGDQRRRRRLVRAADGDPAPCATSQ